MKCTVDNYKMNLYFQKYKYRLTLSLPGIQYFRYVKTHIAFLARLDDMVYAGSGFGLQFSTKKLEDLLNEKGYSIEKLKDYFIFNENISSQYDRKVVTYDTVYYYGNNKEDLATIINHLPNVEYTLNYVDQLVNFNKDVVYHKNPKHKMRMYFKFARIETTEDINDFRTFINTSNCYPSRNLSRTLLYGNSFLKKDVIVLFDNYYVDFDDEVFVTLFGLKYPNLIKKISPIVKR